SGEHAVPQLPRQGGGRRARRAAAPEAAGPGGPVPHAAPEQERTAFALPPGPTPPRQAPVQGPLPAAGPARADREPAPEQPSPGALP
ncbi:2-oxoglutarate dehydrogenase, E2 component, dihydrolipoamide succinyltransferase, partial [Streptomyces sp. URMC 125]